MIPFDPARIDRASAIELRDAVRRSRTRLLDVLHARERTLSSISSWEGPHRKRFDADARELLAAGHTVDAGLQRLLGAIDTALATTTTGGA